MSNRTMLKARKNKNDEFYTQLRDIENEMRHYREHFKDKIIYMNTDHPDRSEFWRFFKLQFNIIKAKRIVSTYYSHDGTSFKTVYDGKNEVRTKLHGDGDFRSEECIDILKKSDIVVTNPPFSLFREFIELMVEHEKKFIILGNSNTIGTKAMFELIKNQKVWTGMHYNRPMEFKVPQHYELKGNSGRVSNGEKFVSVPAIAWFTNLDYPKRHEDLLLWASYEGSEHEYPNYDNYDAINVDRVSFIPYDYEGVMGVPITFIGSWNPEQFEVLGITNSGEENPGIRLPNTEHGRAVVNGEEKYFRILIRNKKPRKTLIPED